MRVAAHQHAVIARFVVKLLLIRYIDLFEYLRYFYSYSGSGQPLRLV